MTQIFQTVHPQSDLKDFWDRRYPAKDLAELRAAVVAHYGPFPILFSLPGNPKWDGQGPGVVITGLAHMPGGEERTERPFLGAVAVGYVPAMGMGGLTLQNLNKICTPAWDANTVTIEAIDPHKGSGAYEPADETDAPPLSDLRQ